MKPILITILSAALTLPLAACKDSAEKQEQAQEEKALDAVYGNLTSSKIKKGE